MLIPAEIINEQVILDVLGHRFNCNLTQVSQSVTPLVGGDGGLDLEEALHFIEVMHIEL
jgi:hypothetical protein